MQWWKSTLRLRVRRKRAKNHHKETRRVWEKKGTIETKKRLLALFDALVTQNFDWLFLRAKAAVNNRASSHLVSVGRYGLQTSGMSRNRVAKNVKAILRNCSLECHEMFLLVLRDIRMNGWV